MFNAEKSKRREDGRITRVEVVTDGGLTMIFNVTKVFRDAALELSRCLSNVRLVALFADDNVNDVRIFTLDAMRNVEDVVGGVILEGEFGGSKTAHSTVGITREEAG